MPEGMPSNAPEEGPHLGRRYHGSNTLHRSKPDYTGPRFSFTDAQRDVIRGRLAFLYGDLEAAQWLPEVERICQVYWAHKPPEMLASEARFDPLERFTEEDVILITYGDLIHGQERSPLKTLSKFCGLQLQGCINTLHILPFFPYSSDRGFAVIDFDTVDPRLGTWEDLEDLETRYKLMFDGVINHVSSQSRWFQEFLNAHPHYRKYFVSFRAPEELVPEDRERIFRPRASDVLTPYPGLEGLRYVWTTFSADQVDLDYRNPEVLIRVLEVLLTFVRRGADLIRLDAVTYLWRRIGTACIHLPETHETIKLFRDVLRAVAPRVALVTETNVPHAENIAYFGNGDDETHLVYNFALPPMLLHTFYTGDVTRLRDWARTMLPPSGHTGFMNFLDSHDGIGLLAVRDLMAPDEVQALVDRAREHGGLVSERTDKGGSTTPYEINITWYSALNSEDCPESTERQVDRFIATRAIAMSLRGVPGIYIHSLLGTRNDREAALRTGVKRDINRRTLDYDSILAAMADPATSTHQVLHRLIGLLRIRIRERAFHPRGPQEVLDLGPAVFGLLRRSPEGDRHVLVLVRVDEAEAELPVDLAPELPRAAAWVDLLTGEAFPVSAGGLSVLLRPYGVRWLVPGHQSHPCPPA